MISGFIRSDFLLIFDAEGLGLIGESNQILSLGVSGVRLFFIAADEVDVVVVVHTYKTITSRSD